MKTRLKPDCHELRNQSQHQIMFCFVADWPRSSALHQQNIKQVTMVYDGLQTYFDLI
jgi:hypothetical protein